MDPTPASDAPAVLAAALGSWSFPPLGTAAILLGVAVYARGWWALHRQRPDRFPPFRLAAFAAAAAMLLVAIASPLEALSGLLLTVHMAQHFLLVMVVPPLTWLSAPAIPLLRGLPVAGARAIGPFLAAPELRRLSHRLTHPVVGLLAFTLALWTWHAPELYELALRDAGWHRVEHATFLAGALLFWFPVIRPWPALDSTPRWAIPPMLLLADLQNTALCAIFAFSDRVLYPTYAAAPRLFGTTALGDQHLAGALMWVPGQVAMLVPAALVVARLLAPQRSDEPHPTVARRKYGGGPGAVRATTPPDGRRGDGLDLLRVPVLGRVLRHRVTRRVAQATTLGLAVAIVADGLRGPAMAPMNLAGVLPWTWFRGLSILLLLVAGNVFCFACPFVLPREIAKRAFPDRLRARWPRRLRGKWFAAALLIAWFWGYEAAAPWDAPRATAWLVLGYFAAAFAVDAAFRGAAFCKWVCPIGQWNFVASTVSPFVVAVQRPDACASCTGRECLRGSPASRGCETELFLPRKTGNLDCTFCLDCVRACPHDAIGLVARAPLAELPGDARRSSIGRPSRRPDLAALVLVFVFAAFANAAGMIGAGVPIGDGSAVANSLLRSAWIPAALAVLPLATVTACAFLSRRMGELDARPRDLACRFALALVPIGVGMWAAHLLFHLATGAGAIVPVARRALEAVAPTWFARLGPPDWSAARGSAAGWLDPAKLLLLDAGLCATLWVAWRIARSLARSPRAAVGAVLPWAILAWSLWGCGVWILLQPMQMRGTMVH